MPRSLTPELDYIRKLYAPQDALLDEIERELQKRGMAIQLGAEEGRILQLLIALHGARSVVEVGTLAGYSALWMARALPEGGHVYTIDREQAHVDLARGFFARSEVNDRITSLEGDAQAVLARLSPKGPFDMIFIDADKQNYNAYLDWAEANIGKGGLVVADNTLLFGAAPLNQPPPDIAPATWEAMRRFNARLADRARYNATMLPTQEGLTVAVKRF